MKKRIIICAALLTLSFGNARLVAQTQVQQGTPITLTCSFDPDIVLGNPPRKAPPASPTVTLDDHTLYIWSQHSGYTLTLLDDDTVVHQTYVAPGTQTASLPSTLSGSFTLQLSNDTFVFSGMIDLE